MMRFGDDVSFAISYSGGCGPYDRLATVYICDEFENKFELMHIFIISHICMILHYTYDLVDVHDFDHVRDCYIFRFGIFN